jgi:tetratricopeptide (TPR) repeat protein
MQDMNSRADRLFTQGKVEAALLAYQQAVASHSDVAESYEGLGAASLLCGDFETAIESYQFLLKRTPCGPATFCNLGHAYLFSGSFDKALRCFYRCLALHPGYVDAHMGLALAHLALGRFKQGWRHYERRRQTQMPVPQWKGESLAGRRILIHAEQGLGDTIQFVRYVPLVAARGGEVVLQVPPPLRRLLSQMEGVTQVISSKDPFPWASCHSSLLSLPRIFGTDITTIPAAIPYLSCSPAESDAWTGHPTKVGLKAGLVWAGDPRNSRDRHRSISLQSLQPLFEIAGVSLFSLQRGEAAGQVRDLSSQTRLHNLKSHHSDLYDMAAAIAALDLVISVDTSVAHLAGALGKPVWILLPYVADWRWLLHRPDSPWYPTARLFRQPKPGDWKAVIDLVTTALRERVNRGETE